MRAGQSRGAVGNDLVHRPKVRSLAMLAEQSYCVAVIRWRPPPFSRANVLGDVYACLNGSDERALDSPEPDRIRTTALVLPGLDGGSELPVGPGDPRLLIKVDLPGQRFPANPRDLVVLEEESSADCHPPG